METRLKQLIKIAIVTVLRNFVCFFFAFLLIFEHALPPSLKSVKK